MCAAAAVLPFETSPGEGAVQIAPGLLEEIRDRVLDGYAAAPHGGVELGFVLFGRSGDDGVAVEHFRQIPCDHLLSPRFLLSPEEENHFPEWLNTLSIDPQLQGAEPVGWGCSHHRSDFALLDREIVFHHRYFSHGNQVVMVVKPQSMQAVLAGIFLPDRHGALHTGSPSIHLRSAVLDSAANRELKSAGERAPQVVQAPEIREQARRPDVEQKMKLVHGHKRHFRFPRWWIGVPAALTLLAALLAIGFTGEFRSAGAVPTSTSLSVAIRPQATDLVFTWKGSIGHVKSAKIEVLDGTASSTFDVTTNFQPAGVFVFPHKTGNVQAVLTVRTDAGTIVRSTGFVDGRMSADDQNAVQVASEHDAAARLDATNRRLTALVTALQSRREQRGK